MGLHGHLAVAAALVGLGLWGVLSQLSIVRVMMGLMLMLNGVLLAAVAFWHFVAPASARGQVFALAVLTLLVVEAAMGLAMVIATYRARQADTVDAVRELRE